MKRDPDASEPTTRNPHKQKPPKHRSSPLCKHEADDSLDQLQVSRRQSGQAFDQRDQRCVLSTKNHQSGGLCNLCRIRRKGLLPCSRTEPQPLCRNSEPLRQRQQLGLRRHRLSQQPFANRLLRNSLAWKPLVENTNNPRWTGNWQPKALNLALQALTELNPKLFTGNFHSMKATNVSSNSTETNSIAAVTFGC